MVNMEVYAKYLEPVSSNWSAVLATLMGQIKHLSPELQSRRVQITYFQSYLK